MNCRVRKYQSEDLESMRRIWNEVVEEANAFPQEFPLKAEEAEEFFASQSFTGVAELEGKVVGVYILHPNNVGRCGHLANASYAVSRDARGRQSERRWFVIRCQRDIVLVFVFSSSMR